MEYRGHCWEIDVIVNFMGKKRNYIYKVLYINTKYENDDIINSVVCNNTHIFNTKI